MIPILIDLHFIKIYTFGVFAAAALLWGFFVLWKHIKLTSYKEESIFDCVFVSLFGALIISRLMYVAFHFKTFGFNLLKIILVNGYPGMSLIGFIIGFFAVFALFLLKVGIDVKRGIDYTATPMLVALSLSKIGSFLSGVDVGTKTTLPIAVKYVGYGGMRHITAFYEAVLYLFCAFVAQKMLFAVRRERLPTGAVFFWFVLSFSGITMFLDKIKANHLYLGGLSVNVGVSSVLFITAVVYFIVINRQKIIKTFLSVFARIKLKKNDKTIGLSNTNNSHTKEGKS